MTGVSNNVVGGPASELANVISGNNGDGVFVDAGSGSNTVVGNLIGTDASGTLAVPNTGDGVDIAGFNNTVGGTLAVDRNVISGNAATGLAIDGTAATNNVVEGNYIGTDVRGTTQLANGADGVDIFAGAMNNVVGGTATGDGNVISGNGASGVVITGQHGHEQHRPGERHRHRRCRQGRDPEPG